MERSEALKRLGVIAADQWGLVTARQAQNAGLSRVDLGRLIDAELLLRAAHGVYQLAGGTPTPHLEIKAAWLRLDPGTFAWERPLGADRSGVVSHGSACQLHNIGDIPADNVQISVPVRRTTREAGVTFHKTAIPTDDITIADGLPVTTVDRTICDLLQARADGGHVGRVLADADQHGLTDTRTLAERVQPYTRAYGLPKTATGTDLLNFLADQAGFTLRDERLTAAGERAALNSAMNPEALLEALLAQRTPPPGMAAAVEAVRAAALPAPPGMAAAVEAVRAAALFNRYEALHHTTAELQRRRFGELAERVSALVVAQAPNEAMRQALERLHLQTSALPQMEAATAQLAVTIASSLSETTGVAARLAALTAPLSTAAIAAQISRLADTSVLTQSTAEAVAGLPELTTPPGTEADLSAPDDCSASDAN